MDSDLRSLLRGAGLRHLSVKRKLRGGILTDFQLDNLLNGMQQVFNETNEMAVVDEYMNQQLANMGEAGEAIRVREAFDERMFMGLVPSEDTQRTITQESAEEVSDEDKEDTLSLDGKGRYIKMPKKNFIKEHKHLIGLLRSSPDKRFQKEANDQAAELKRTVDGMVGASKMSGFIQRLMWENKHKHKGAYKKPTFPLAKDSKMNAQAEFKFKMLANEEQDGENEADYGASPFIRRHFGTVKAKVGKVGRPGRSNTDRDRVRAFWNADKTLTTRDIVKKMKDQHNVVISQPTVSRILKELRPKFDLKSAVAKDAEKAKIEVAAIKAKKAAKAAPAPRVTLSNGEITNVISVISKANKMVAKNLAKNIRKLIDLKERGLDGVTQDWTDALGSLDAMRNPPRENSPEDQKLINNIADRIEAWSKQPLAVK